MENIAKEETTTEIEELKIMLRHIHEHIEYLLVKLERHDKRLSELSSILLRNYDIKDWNSVLNIDIDIEDEHSLFSPVDKEDREDWEKICNTKRNKNDI